ncbi:MAG TPA: hypothetical protein ENH62_05805 [Marinobacter sp.]|uniref:Uncharacterized protein n=1 Tax=marine sediment metagenome TaxID=412755 RepID=A0A0F9TA95_9ZZZZ|nr:hypothetical protein [Marinobacter sp.]
MTSNQLPSPDYPEAIATFGSRNVEAALIFISSVSDPRTGLAILLGADDESVYDAIEAAFAADKRAELNSESWGGKLSDAISTVLYTFDQAVVLLPNGTMRVSTDKGDVTFAGNEFDFVRWVRDNETVEIDQENTNERVTRGGPCECGACPDGKPELAGGQDRVIAEVGSAC